MVSIPTFDLKTEKPREPNLNAISAAFNAQLIAEREQKSPVQSFKEGVTAVQDVVTGQQEIDLNKSKIAEAKIRERLAKELEKQNVEFLDILAKGTPQEQVNALTRFPQAIVERNLPAANAVADQLDRNGSLGIKQGVEVFRRAYAPEKIAELQEKEENHRRRLEVIDAQQDRIDARAEKKLPLERRRVEATEENAETSRRRLIEQKRQNRRKRREEARKSRETEDKVATQQFAKDSRDFAIQLEKSNSVIDPATGDTQGKQSANNFLSLMEDGRIAFSTSKGAPTEINGVLFQSLEEYQNRVKQGFASQLSPERRNLVGIGSAAQTKATKILRKGETPNQASQRILAPLKQKISEGAQLTTAELEAAVDELKALAAELGKNPSRESLKNLIVQELRG